MVRAAERRVVGEVKGAMVGLAREGERLKERKGWEEEVRKAREAR